MTSFVDTNIFVYAFDLDSPTKLARAQRIIEALFAGKHQTSAQVLGEFSRVMTEKKHVSKEVVSEFLQGMPKAVPHYTTKTICKAIDLQKHQLSFWDAVIAATMLENNIHEIYTEDERFNKVPGIKAINPFSSE